MATSGKVSDLRAVTIKVAAEWLSVSKRTLQRLIAAGKFPTPIKVGASTRVLVTDVECFIERQRRQGPH